MIITLTTWDVLLIVLAEVVIIAALIWIPTEKAVDAVLRWLERKKEGRNDDDGNGKRNHKQADG